MSENREVSGENQFEENIDFAAYLNLDQFEKGSLMGGSEVEAQFLKYEFFALLLFDLFSDLKNLLS